MRQPELAKPPKQAFHRELVGYAWTETAVSKRTGNQTETGNTIK